MRNILARAIQNLHGIDQMLPCLAHVNHIGADLCRDLQAMAFLQTRNMVLRAVRYDGFSVINLGQIPCCNSQGTLSGKVGGIGRILGDILRCERHICADFVPIFVGPVDEVVAIICLRSGTRTIAPVDNRLTLLRHAAAFIRLCSIGHRILQLLQLHSNRCAAGDIVQGPACALTVYVEYGRLTTASGGAEFVGLNTLNVISRRNRFNRQSDICAIQLLIVIIDIAVNFIEAACKVMGTAQIFKGDIFRSFHDLAVQEDLNLDLGARTPNLLPDGIQGIDAALVVDNIVFPSLKFSRRRTGIRRPAQELKAIPAKAQILSRLQSYGFIVGNILRLCSAYAAVGMINQGGSRSLVAPLGIEDNLILVIGTDLSNQQLVARLVDGIHTIKLPAQEHLALRSLQRICRPYLRKGLVGISSAVHWNCAAAAVGVIHHGKFRIAGVVGVEGNILGQLGVKVKGSIDISILCSPAVPGVFILIQSRLVSIQRRLFDGFTVENDNLRCIASTSHGQVNGSSYLRSSPLGVQNQVARRHGGTFEHKLRPIQTSLSSVPTLERELFINSIGTVRDKIGPADVGFELVGIRLYSRIMIVKSKLIRVSCVIEPNIVVAIAPRPVILFFTCICESKNVFCIPIGSLIVHSLVIERAIIIFTVQPLQHIVQLIFSCITLPQCCVGCGGTVGFAADQVRRKIQAFRGISAIISVPSCKVVDCILPPPFINRVLSNVVRSRPQVGNILLILGSKGITPTSRDGLPINHHYAFCVIATGIQVKLNSISIPLIVNIDDGTVVACNLYCIRMIIVEVIVVFVIQITRRRCCASDSLSGCRLREGISVIVRILFPIEHLIIDSLPLPPGSQRYGIIQGTAKLIRSIAALFVPALEGIAQAGGSGRLCRDGIRGHKDRGDVAAAVRLKGDPAALSYLGVEGNVGTIYDNIALDKISQLLVAIPSHNAFVRTHGESHIGGGNRIVANTFLGGADHALLVQEEDIVHLLEDSMVGVGYTSDIIFLTGGEGIASSICAGIPTGELAVLLLRGLRSVDSFTGHDILGVYQLLIHKKLICINIVFVRFYHIHRRYHAVAGLTILCPYVQRQHGEHHDKCQECGEYPFC